MSLSPKITVYPGTANQQNVGIMGRAVLEINSGNQTVVRFSNLQIRKSKGGKWWVQYPAEEDRTGKKDENGYPVRYPYFVLFPGDSGKTTREQIHTKIIEECQRQLSAGGVTTKSAPPVNHAPVINTAPPVQAAVGGDDGLNWDLDD